MWLLRKIANRGKQIAYVIVVAITVIFIAIEMIAMMEKAVNTRSSIQLDIKMLDFQQLQKVARQATLMESKSGEMLVLLQLRDPDSTEPTNTSYSVQTNSSNTYSVAETNVNKDAHINYADQTAYPLTLFDNPYIINNEHLCPKDTNIYFVVIVHTATHNVMKRAAIRETWANRKLFQNYTMRLVFLLGMPVDDATQLLIEHESVIHEDIIQGRFLDTYRNLTHKAVLGLRWLTEYCPQSQYVVKVDDDVFVNIFRLLDFFETRFNGVSRHIWCPYQIRPVIRRDNSKWSVDKNDFKNMTRFPVSFCQGYFVVLTSDIIAEMYSAANSTPFFWIDDVYAFGLLVDKAGRINCSSLGNLNSNEDAGLACMTKRDYCPLMVTKASSEGVMETMWQHAIKQSVGLVKKYATRFLLNT